MKKVLLPLIAVCCLAPVAAFAGHPLVTDGATTVEVKHIEAETAFEYHMIDNDGSKGKLTVLQETLTFGLANKVDAFVYVPFKMAKPDGGSSENGLADITVGAKWNFYKAGTAELAIKPMVTIPTGDEKKGADFGAGKAAFGGLFAVSAEVSKEVNVHANVMVMHQLVKVGDAYNVLGLSAAGAFDASKELKVVGEIAASKADVSGAKWLTKFTAGAVYALKENIDIDGGLSYGIQDKNKDLGILAGVTFKF